MFASIYLNLNVVVKIERLIVIDSEQSEYPISVAVGKKIKALRLKSGLTSSELGAYLGVSQQQMSRYENGINRIDIEKLVKLSFYFKVSIYSFFEENE